MPIHLGLEKPDRRSLLGLGLVQGDVRLAQRLFGDRCVMRHQGDSNSGSDAVLVRPECDRILEALHDPDRNAGRTLGSGTMSRDHGKLVSAQPGEQVVIPHRCGKPLGHDDKDIVPGCVTVNVVDGLEPVQIEHQHRMNALRAGRRSGSFSQGFLELPAVRKAGQGVGMCQLVRSLLCRNPPRDLAFLLDHSPPAEIDNAKYDDNAESDRLLKLDALVLRQRSAEIVLKRDHAGGDDRTGEQTRIQKTNAVMTHPRKRLRNCERHRPPSRLSR